MANTIHSANYSKLLAIVRRERERAGLTQAALAEQLGRPQSWVSKVEVGERRLDIEELRQLCEGLGVDPLVIVRSWLKAID